MSKYKYKYKPDDYLPQVGDVCEHEDNGLFIVTHIFRAFGARDLGRKLGYSYHPSTCKTLVTKPGAKARPGDKVIHIGDNGEARGRAKIGQVYTAQEDTDNEYIYWHPTNGHYCRYSSEFLVLVQEDEPEFEYPIYKISGKTVIKFEDLSFGTVVVADEQVGNYLGDCDNFTPHTDTIYSDWNPQFDYDTIMQPNTAVHCTTESEANELLYWADQQGVPPFINKNTWKIWNKNTIYLLRKQYPKYLSINKETHNTDFTILTMDEARNGKQPIDTTNVINTTTKEQPMNKLTLELLVNFVEETKETPLDATSAKHVAILTEADGEYVEYIYTDTIEKLEDIVRIPENEGRQLHVFDYSDTLSQKPRKVVSIKRS